MDNDKDIYEMFSGQIDHDIIKDIILSCNGDKTKMVDLLLELSQLNNYQGSSNPLPSANSQPLSKPSNDICERYQNGSVSANNFSETGSWNKPSILPNPITSKNTIGKCDKDGTSNAPVSNNLTVMKHKEAVAVVRKYIENNEKVLVLLRGCPGSGKSTLAKKLRFEGVILSTDEFLIKNGKNNCATALLSSAHEQNQELVLQAMNSSNNPIIIDSLNTQIWEMLPYASMASIYGYAVEVIEPYIPWRLKPDLLAKKTVLGIKQDKIASMLDEYHINIRGIDLLQMVRETSQKSNKNLKHESLLPSWFKADRQFQNKFEFEKLPLTFNLPEKQGFSSQVIESDSTSMFTTLPSGTEFDRITETSDSIDSKMLQFLHSCFPGVDKKLIENIYSEKSQEPEKILEVLTQIGSNDSLNGDEHESESESESEDVLKSFNGDGSTSLLFKSDKSKKYSNSANGELAPLVISPELGEQLLQLFGKPPNFKPEDNYKKGYPIKISVDLAHMIYQSWTGESKWDKSDLKSDVCSDTSFDPAYDSDVLNTDDRSNFLSAKLKLKQLEEKFPDIDKQDIKKIFAASGYKMIIAIEKIKNTPRLQKFRLPGEIGGAQIEATQTKLESHIKRIDFEHAKTNHRSLDQSCFELEEKMEYSKGMYKENIGKAKKSFTQKKFVQAHSYSMKAQEWKNQFLKEKEEHAELLVKKMYENVCHSGSMDLHGLTVKAALDLVSEFLKTYSIELSRKRSHFFIITGRGVHSPKGVAKIKPCIEKYLRNHNYQYTETNPGTLKVDL